MEKLQLSSRANDWILEVARAGADLAEREEIRIEHLAEAIQYWSFDREEWPGNFKKDKLFYKQFLSFTL